MARAKAAKPVILTAEQIAALHILDAHVGSATGALGEITLRAREALALGVPQAQVLAAAGLEQIGQLLEQLAHLEPEPT